MRHVLIVDDDSLLRWALAETLSAYGYEVSEAADGASALRAFKAAPKSTDLVLLDLCLPDCDDLHVLAAFRAMRPDMPVILMTAYGTFEISEQAAHMGAIVTNKPFDMSEIAAIVERAFEVKRH